MELPAMIRTSAIGIGLLLSATIVACPPALAADTAANVDRPAPDQGGATSLASG